MKLILPTHPFHFSVFFWHYKVSILIILSLIFNISHSINWSELRESGVKEKKAILYMFSQISWADGDSKICSEEVMMLDFGQGQLVGSVGNTEEELET